MAPHRNRVRIHLACQGQWYTCAQLGRGVTNDVFLVHGAAVKSSTANTEQEMLDATAGEIDDRLDEYFDVDRPEIDTTSGACFVLDIEQPFHPSDLHLETAGDQLLIIDAWKLRIERFKLKFPSATVGMYATLVPDNRGDDSDATYIAQKAALMDAATAGLYDDLDWMVPILFQRFGPRDTFGSWGATPLMFAQGLRDSKLLSPGKRVMPLYSAFVQNGASQHHGVCIADLPALKSGGVASQTRAPVDNLMARTWGLLRKLCAEHDVPDLCLWVANPQFPEDIGGEDAVNPNGRTVDDFLTGD